MEEKTIKILSDNGTVELTPSEWDGMLRYHRLEDFADVLKDLTNTDYLTEYKNKLLEQNPLTKKTETKVTGREFHLWLENEAEKWKGSDNSPEAQKFQKLLEETQNVDFLSSYRKELKSLPEAQGMDKHELSMGALGRFLKDMGKQGKLPESIADKVKNSEFLESELADYRQKALRNISTMEERELNIKAFEAWVKDKQAQKAMPPEVADRFQKRMKVFQNDLNVLVTKEESASFLQAVQRAQAFGLDDANLDRIRKQYMNMDNLYDAATAEMGRASLVRLLEKRCSYGRSLTAQEWDVVSNEAGKIGKRALKRDSVEKTDEVRALEEALTDSRLTVAKDAGHMVSSAAGLMDRPVQTIVDVGFGLSDIALDALRARKRHKTLTQNKFAAYLNRNLSRELGIPTAEQDFEKEIQKSIEKAKDVSSKTGKSLKVRLGEFVLEIKSEINQKTNRTSAETYFGKDEDSLEKTNVGKIVESLKKSSLDKLDKLDLGEAKKIARKITGKADELLRAPGQDAFNRF